jgi:crotonobetainyl-CoA:carnitine CoA-transferase CaiB-like acyl-CoA transferase
LNSKQRPDLLSAYQVLDLTGETGFLCSRLLGDLGADVIKIEHPGGGPGRDIGPYYHDIQDPEKSLYWFAYNCNKRGITLNIEAPRGQEILKRLIKTAHFLIESFPPGYMDGLGLGYSTLARINPGLVVTSITPFGQTGPHKDYKATDLVITAMSGLMYTTGDPDRPPVRNSVAQSYVQAGAQAAVASMFAHYHRQITGEGQHVDVSMQDALHTTAMVAAVGISRWRYMGELPSRGGERSAYGTIKARHVWPCQDGYIGWRLYVGLLGNHTRRIVEWMDAEGVAGVLKEVSWEQIGLDQVDQQQWDYWESAFSQFFLSRSKSELLQVAIEKGFILAPVNTPVDLVKHEQLQYRGFWEDVWHPELDASIIYPGAIYKSGVGDCGIWMRAPLIGEHNEQIYIEQLGFTVEELARLEQDGVI